MTNQAIIPTAHNATRAALIPIPALAPVLRYVLIDFGTGFANAEDDDNEEEDGVDEGVEEWQLPSLDWQPVPQKLEFPLQ
jgi:hypothetical protein